MCSGADFLCFVTRRYLEHNSLSLGLDYLGFSANSMTDWRRCKVPNVYFGTDCALICPQKWL